MICLSKLFTLVEMGGATVPDSQTWLLKRQKKDIKLWSTFFVNFISFQSHFNLDLSRLKAFADDNTNVDWHVRFVLVNKQKTLREKEKTGGY